MFKCAHLLFFVFLLIFTNTGVYAENENYDNNKLHNKDEKKYHKKMWGGEGKWKQCPMKNMFGQCPMMKIGPPPMMEMGGSFAMIEAQGRLFLYNKQTGGVWVCNASKKICEKLIIEN